jgi:putative hemolysin
MAAVFESGQLRAHSPMPVLLEVPGARATRAAGVSPVLARAGNLTVSLASAPAQIEQALRLRHRVFVQELGARDALRDGLERDIFDPYCRHLVVRDEARDAVVGTYRLLMPEAAKALGCLYADREFWLTRLNPLRDSIVELGRTCVAPDYRNGAAIMLLWSGVGTLLASCGHRHLLGCVSVPMDEDGGFAARIYHRLASRHLADDTLRVWPRERLAVDRFEPADVALPPLVRGYLHAGAKVLGEPHVDSEFGCADFPMMLSIENLSPRHRRRFMR